MFFVITVTLIIGDVDDDGSNITRPLFGIDIGRGPKKKEASAPFSHDLRVVESVIDGKLLSMPSDPKNASPSSSQTRSLPNRPLYSVQYPLSGPQHCRRLRMHLQRLERRLVTSYG